MSDGGKVAFLIAGVQKGGTSALFDYLRESPAIQMPAVKEAHFFDDETVDWAADGTAPDIAAYHALFEDDARLRGEATPIYIYWPNSLERIARYNPAMKVILLLRDPVERAWSHWKMEYAKRKEREPFAWCIREGRERLADGDPSAPGHHRVFSYVERGFYGSQVERLFSLFPRDNCLLLRSEELRDDPGATLDRVCHFLGVPTFTSIEPRIVHAARDIEYSSELRREDRTLLSAVYHPEMKRLENLTGMDTSCWAKHHPGS